MNELEQAARQALEANRALREWINAVPKETVLPPMPGIDGDWLDSVDAALHQAFEQPKEEPYDQTALELCEVCGWKTLIPGDCCLNCERTADQPKPEPVQEPVAWTWDTKNQRDGFLDAHFQFSKPESHSLIMNLRPLYTEPPQRKPLTYDKIDAVAEKMPGGIDGFMKGWGWRQFARAIEAAHGIKG